MMRFVINSFYWRCLVFLVYVLLHHDESLTAVASDDSSIINPGAGGIGNYYSIQVETLTTEYMDSPLGVDKAIPRVSWKIQNNDGGDANDQSIFTSTTVNDADANATTQRIRRRGVFQQKYQLHVYSLPPPSSSCSSCDDNGWNDCGWVSSNETHLVPLDCNDLTPISTSDMHVSWKVSVMLDDDSVIESDIANFRTGIFGPWKAQWITGGKVDDDDDDSSRNNKKDRTLLRKEFLLTTKANSHNNIINEGEDDGDGDNYATLFVSGIGYNHVYLNGVKVGDHQLDPGWTNFTKRVWYTSYDVTHMLQFDDNVENGVLSSDAVANNNVIAVMLGNGWWSCGPPPGTKQSYCTNDPPQLILQLHINGHPVLISDETWRASADSPIIYNSIYNGEIYDARIAESIEGWTSLHYDDEGWSLSKIADTVASKAILSSQLFEPIRHISTRSPISIVVSGKADNNLTQVLDFGQNQAGIVRLKRFFCPRGTQVTLRHAELIMHPPYGYYDNSTIYVENMRTAKPNDYYICTGNLQGESYTPTFTYHGFRYVEVTGLNHALDPSDVAAVEMHTDVKQTSLIKFADPLLNKIQHMVMWGLKSNFMSVQTDCNQRDERKGWMGDAALTAEAAVLSYDMGAFYTHWLVRLYNHSLYYCRYQYNVLYCKDVY